MNIPHANRYKTQNARPKGEANANVNVNTARPSTGNYRTDPVPPTNSGEGTSTSGVFKFAVVAVSALVFTFMR